MDVKGQERSIHRDKVDARALGAPGLGGGCCPWDGVSCLGNDNVLRPTVVMIAQILKFTKNHSTVYFKRPNFDAHELSLSFNNKKISGS